MHTIHGFQIHMQVLSHNNIGTALHEEGGKVFALEHTCAPLAFGNLICKEQICALTEFTDESLCLTELQEWEESWFTF